MRHFFHLPQELRDEVYRELFSSSPCNPQALRVCKQFYREALPFVYTHELRFGSQNSLWQWLERRGALHASYVKAIRLAIHDIDLSPLLDSLSSQPPPRPRSPELFNQELERLEHALRKLTNLHELTLDRVQTRPPRSHQRLALCRSFIELVTRLCPRLCRLSFDTDQQSLVCVAGLRNLQSLRLTGYSQHNTPAETLEILLGLPQLTELEIDNTPKRPFCLSQNDYHGERPHQSISPDVLRNLRPLKSFSILDCDVCYPSGRPKGSPKSDSMFITAEMFQALHNSHHASLEKLQISYDGLPDKKAIEVLNTFLRASCIRRLDVSLPGELPLIRIDALPRTLRSFRIQYYLSDGLSLWTKELLGRKRCGTLPMLNEVILRNVLDDCDGVEPLKSEVSYTPINTCRLLLMLLKQSVWYGREPRNYVRDFREEGVRFSLGGRYS